MSFLACKHSLGHLKGSFKGLCCLASKHHIPFTSSTSCSFKPQIKTLQELFILTKSIVQGCRLGFLAWDCGITVQRILAVCKTKWCNVSICKKCLNLCSVNPLTPTMLVKFIFNFIHVCQAQCQKTSCCRQSWCFFQIYLFYKKNINTKSNSKQTNTTWANAKRKKESWVQNIQANRENTRQRQEDITNQEGRQVLFYWGRGDNQTQVKLIKAEGAITEEGNQSENTNSKLWNRITLKLTILCFFLDHYIIYGRWGDCTHAWLKKELLSSEKAPRGSNQRSPRPNIWSIYLMLCYV